LVQPRINLTQFHSWIQFQNKTLTIFQNQSKNNVTCFQDVNYPLLCKFWKTLIQRESNLDKRMLNPQKTFWFRSMRIHHRKSPDIRITSLSFQRLSLQYLIIETKIDRMGWLDRQLKWLKLDRLTYSLMILNLWLLDLTIFRDLMIRRESIQKRSCIEPRTHSKYLTLLMTC